MSEKSKKTAACFECLNLVDIENKKPFDMVACSECGKSVCVTQKLGDWILEEQLSKNEVYSTFKGSKSGKSDPLVFKIIHHANFDEKLFQQMEALQVKLPDNCGMKAVEAGGHFIFYRPYFETSLKDYLKNSRPRAAKAVAIMKEAAEVLQKTVRNNVYPASIPVGNLLMDEFGKTVLSDLTFRQDLQKLIGQNDLLQKNSSSEKFIRSGSATASDTVFAFAALSHFLCCGKYPGKESKLDLRDEVPEGLESLIQCLIHDRNPLSTINEVLYKIGEIQKGEYKEIELTGEPKANTKKQSVAKTKKPVKKSIKPPAANTMKPKRRKKAVGSSAVTLAVVLVIVLGLAAVAVLSNKGNTDKKITVAEKAVKPKPQKKVRKVTPKAPVLKKTPLVSKPVIKNELKPVDVVAPEAEPEPQVNISDIKENLVPLDFNFDRLNSVIDEYLDAASGNKDLEGERIDIVSTYRDHILYHFHQRPFTGIFYVEGMKLFRGTVKDANEDKIQIVDLKTGKESLVTWDKLKFEQFMEFADYYAAAYSDQFSISEDNSPIFKKVADEYKRLAVFLDWYGKKEKAVNYKNKALKFDSEAGESLDKMVVEGES